MIDLLAQAGSGHPEPGPLQAIAADYGLEVDRDSIPRLCKEYGVTFGPPPE
jgi:hypothetical protein